MNSPYFLAWCFFRVCFGVFFRARFHHPERVPARGPVILAANHASFFDPPLIGSGLRRMVNFLARDTLFPVPVVGWWLRAWRVVPVDRAGGATGLRNILERLLSGVVVLLFPEGTRTSDGRLQPARSGVGLIVIKSTAPVVPVRVCGTFDAYGRHHRWPRPRRLTVWYGPPMNFEKLRAEAKTCSKPRLKEIYGEVAVEIMAAIAALDSTASGVVSPASPLVPGNPGK